MDRDEIADWVMNDEALYNWFQGQRPRGNRFEDDPTGELELEDLEQFITDNYDSLCEALGVKD